ncbi:serine hydrolase domain-containing protein [Chitinimonas sp.]|uniref:serine hydrolase domain-containing protein n=1 Tax=Chitinimonas sp. TaxID=1934313 RepID=UPI0035AE7DB1
MKRTLFGAMATVLAIGSLLTACNSQDQQALSNPQALTCSAQQPNASPAQQQACTGNLADRADKALQPFLSENGISAASVAIVKDGVVLYQRGFGHLDANRQRPLPADALFMTASIVKPVTAAAVQKLRQGGFLALSDHVFCSGNNRPCWLSGFQATGADPRIADITIAHLLDHQGGWDTDISGDPLISEAAIQQALGLNLPPTRSDIIRAVTAQPLDFVPGTRSAYSNFGYLLLGLIIEQASHATYLTYVQTAVLQPLGIAQGDFVAAPSLLKDRGQREPIYLTSVQAYSVFKPGTMVSALDGAINAENWQAAGSVLSTAPALAKFAGHYRIPEGTLLNGQHNNGGFTGADPGVATLMRQLPSGTSYVVMMNKLDDKQPSGPGSYQLKVLALLEEAIAGAGL